ncbi:hypothetical protein CDAR_311901 [Caerostris darwini]|uniref:Uncharacterized protein n=1 Tax=Caerostris darwini TaxID=1538125 RepID=A0AAV4QWR9_9ARAC|nr:hypothetical protein CDAR_311901 [Caerostris darwini]
MNGRDLECAMNIDVCDASGSLESCPPTDQLDTSNDVMSCNIIKQLEFELGNYQLRKQYLNRLFQHDQKFFPGQDFSPDQKKYKEELMDHEATIEEIKGKIESLGKCPIPYCPAHYCNTADNFIQNQANSNPKKRYAEPTIKSSKMRLNQADWFQRRNKRHFSDGRIDGKDFSDGVDLIVSKI